MHIKFICLNLLSLKEKVTSIENIHYIELRCILTNKTLVNNSKTFAMDTIACKITIWLVHCIEIMN